MSLAKRYLEAQASQTPAAKIESVRACVRTVSRSVQVTEGRVLDDETADTILRTLASAARELAALRITLSVRERRVRNG